MSEKYEFIDAEYAEAVPAGSGRFPAVACMCRWLGVSKSGFYEWWSRPESATAGRRAELKLRVGDIFDDSDGTYGYRRIAAQLARTGVAAGEELVRRPKREPGPGGLPAAAVAAVHDAAGRRGADPGPGEPGLHRGGAGTKMVW